MCEIIDKRVERGIHRVFIGYRQDTSPTLMSLSANPPCIKITLRLPSRVKTMSARGVGRSGAEGGVLGMTYSDETRENEGGGIKEGTKRRERKREVKEG